MHQKQALQVEKAYHRECRRVHPCVQGFLLEYYSKIVQGIV